MSRIYVTFGGRAYDRTIGKQREMACGADYNEHIVYDDRWLIESGFKAKHGWLWEAQPQHGFGHCSWKPYIILDCMQKAQANDLILYTDADTYPIADMSPLFEMCERDGIVLFEEQGCNNRNWIKRDCYIAMGCDEEKYWNAQHGCGRFQLFKNTPFNRAFVEEWGRYAVMPRCQMHDAGQKPNLPEFRRHSTEQAILTLLAHKNNIPLHRTPDQNGWPISPGCGQAR